MPFTQEMSSTLWLQTTWSLTTTQQYYSPLAMFTSHLQHEKVKEAFVGRIQDFFLVA